MFFVLFFISWPAQILDLPYHVEVLFIFLFHLLNHPPFQCSRGVHVHPYQHSQAQRSVPHCVTSSVSVSHPAADSTPASVLPAKFKYTGNEVLALAAPVGQRLKPELSSTLKTLGIGRRLPRRWSCRGGARKVRAIFVAGPSSVHSRDLSPTTVPASFCHHLPCPPSSAGCNPTQSSQH